MPPRLRLPAAFAATLVVAEASALLLRPRERFAKVPVEPRAYFSPEELERAKRFRRGQVRLFAAQSALEPSGTARGIGLFHASPRDPVWEYVLSGLTAELCFDATDFRVSLIGHSHVALSFHRPEGEPASGTTRREGVELDLSTGEWLVNPGSTGQPRDGDPRAAWLVLDTTAKTAVYRRAEYDIAAAQAAIRAARLPESLAERLQYGQ